MGGVTTPSISSSLEETLAQLDRLNEATSQRRRSDALALAAMVGRLGDPFGVEDESVNVVAREGHGQTTRIGGVGSPTPDPEPFVPLPRTTTKPWGAPMRAKFIAEARERGGW